MNSAHYLSIWKEKTLVLCFVVLAIVTDSICFADVSESKIQAAIEGMEDTHFVHLFALYIEPRFLAESGYDSNVLARSAEEIGSYYTTAAPGGGFAVKLGRRGYFEINEDLDFVYYRTLSQLSGVFNTSGGKLVLGTNRILFDLDGSYGTRRAPISSEVDLPVNQKITLGNASVVFALRRTTDLTLATTYLKILYNPVEGTDPIPPPSNNETLDYTATVAQQINEWLSVHSSVITGTTKFFNNMGLELNNSKILDILPGLVLNSRRISGFANAGFGRITQTSGVKAKKDFLLDADIIVLFHRTSTLELEARRGRIISGLLTNNFYLNTEYQILSDVPAGKRFVFEAHYRYGSNGYDKAAVVEGEAVQTDKYSDKGFLIYFKVIGDLYLDFGLSKYIRNSNVQTLVKNRSTIIAGFTYNPFAKKKYKH